MACARIAGRPAAIAAAASVAALLAYVAAAAWHWRAVLEIWSVGVTQWTVVPLSTRFVDPGSLEPEIETGVPPWYTLRRMEAWSVRSDGRIDSSDLRVRAKYTFASGEDVLEARVAGHAVWWSRWTEPEPNRDAIARAWCMTRTLAFRYWPANAVAAHLVHTGDRYELTREQVTGWDDWEKIVFTQECDVAELWKHYRGIVSSDRAGEMELCSGERVKVETSDLFRVCSYDSWHEDWFTEKSGSAYVEVTASRGPHAERLKVRDAFTVTDDEDCWGKPGRAARICRERGPGSWY